MDDSKPSDWDIASEALLKISEMDEPFENRSTTGLSSWLKLIPAIRSLTSPQESATPHCRSRRASVQPGRVIATDQSAAMLAIAEKRARERGLTNIEFRLLDANVYDFPDDTIDAIVCRWGLMFLSDLTERFGRMRRSLKPGRLLAAVTWGEPDKVPIISIRRSVMRAFDIPKEPERSVSSFIGNHARGRGDGCRIRRCEVTRSIVPYEYASVDAFVEAQRDRARKPVDGASRPNGCATGRILARTGCRRRALRGKRRRGARASEILLMAARTRA